MATTEQISATVAVVLVLGIIASSGINTGAATADQYDFNIKGVVFPALTANNEFTAQATFVNTGTLSRSFVTYDYRIWDAAGREIFRSKDNSAVNLPSGETSASLSTVALVKGTYSVKIEIDSQNRFTETDEANNIYRTTITVV